MVTKPVVGSPGWGPVLNAALDDLDLSSRLVVLDAGTVELDNTLARGTIRGFDVVTASTINGAEYAPGVYLFRRTGVGWAVHVVDGEAPPTDPPAETIASDDFNRADTVSGLGVASDGKVWVGNDGVCRLAGNRVTFPNAGMDFVTLRLDVGASDYTVEVDAPSNEPGDPSLVPRWVDDTHHFFIYSGEGVGGHYSITKVNGAGSYSFPLVTAVTPANGDHIKVICTATSLELIVNGASLGTVNDAAFNSGTHVGFTTSRAGTAAFDNLVVTL